MNWHKIQIGIVGLALLGWAQLAPAQELAKLPYAQLYDIQKVQVGLTNTYASLRVSLRMQSSDLKVKSSDLDVFIAAKKGRIPVKIAEDGSFAIPLRDDLHEEDPPVITNQPRGTMRLDWIFGWNVKGLTNPVGYRTLMQPVKDCEPIQEVMRKVFPAGPKLTIVGLGMTFDDLAKGEAVVLKLKSGDRKLTPETDGQVIIPLENGLFEADPQIVMPKLPSKVDIITKKEEE